MTRWFVSIAILVCLGAPLNGQAGTASAVQEHYKRAQEALGAARYDQAAGEFLAILKLEPNRAEIHANLGTVYYAQQRYPEASAAFRKALQLRPTLKGASAFLGMSEARQGRFAEALPLLEKGFQNPLDPQWKLEAGLLLAEAYQQQSDTPKLMQVISALERDFPGNAEAQYLAYRTHSTQAARAVANLVKAAPNSARLRQITAELLEAEGDYAGAVAQYRQALQMEPKLPGVRRALGIALMNSANDDTTRAEAQELFKHELTLNPRDALTEYQLGEVLWAGNQAAEALPHFQRALQLQPKFPDALIAAGKVLISMDQPREAVPLLQKATELDSSNEVGHYRLAQAYQKLGEKQLADREFAEFRRLRASLESLRNIHRQVQETRITTQRVE